MKAGPAYTVVKSPEKFGCKNIFPQASEREAESLEITNLCIVFLKICLKRYKRKTRPKRRLELGGSEEEFGEEVRR